MIQIIQIIRIIKNGEKPSFTRQIAHASVSTVSQERRLSVWQEASIGDTQRNAHGEPPQH
ncbi:MAG: hypothetical protein OSA40_12335 [Phycisphaerales bacterium]|nr:hypothetical protein [Phycisphaerales bacterium]